MSTNTRLALVGVIALVGAVAAAVVFGGDDAPDTVTIHLGVEREVGDTTATFDEGAACEIAASPGEQVVITNDDGDVVAKVSPTAGTIQLGEDGAWVCATSTEVTVDASPLYTFVVNGQYGEVVDARMLEAANWSHVVRWPESPPGAGATPAATPRATPGATPAAA